MAHAILVGCCHEHPEGTKTLAELIELTCGDDEVQWFLDEESDRKRKNRLEKLLTAMRDVLSDYSDRRLSPPLRESEYATGSFLYVFGDNSELPTEVRESRAKYRLTFALRDVLCGLDDTVFEHLCGRLMASIGCIGVTVTKASKDAGIDFVGRLPLAKSTEGVSGDEISLPAFFRLVGGVAFVVYGQVKRYDVSNTVGREPVAQLEGDWRNLASAMVADTLEEGQRAAMKRAQFRLADPVLMVFITTSSFTSGALDTAKNLGIVTLDGVQLAQLLAESSIGVERVSEFEWRTSHELLAAAARA